MDGLYDLRPLPLHVGAAVATEVAFKGRCMVDVPGMGAEHDATLIQTLLVGRCAIRRYARADEPAGRAASACARKGGGDRTRNDQAETWNDRRRTDGKDCGQRCADPTADRTARAEALRLR